MTCFAKNEIYSLKWEKCARCAKMCRLVGARVIFFMRQVTAFFLFGCPSPIGQNKKVQFTTNQCYITNKSSFFAKNWTKSPDWGWKNCQSGIPLPIFETKHRSAAIQDFSILLKKFFGIWMLKIWKFVHRLMDLANKFYKVQYFVWENLKIFQRRTGKNGSMLFNQWIILMKELLSFPIYDGIWRKETWWIFHVIPVLLSKMTSERE